MKWNQKTIDIVKELAESDIEVHIIPGEPRDGIELWKQILYKGKPDHKECIGEGYLLPWRSTAKSIETIYMSYLTKLVEEENDKEDLAYNTLNKSQKTTKSYVKKKTGVNKSKRYSK